MKTIQRILRLAALLGVALRPLHLWSLEAAPKPVRLSARAAFYRPRTGSLAPLPSPALPAPVSLSPRTPAAAEEPRLNAPAGEPPQASLEALQDRPSRAARIFDGARNSGDRPGAQADASEALEPATAQVSASVEQQLAETSKLTGEAERPLLELIGADSRKFLAAINARLKRGTIDPNFELRTAREETPKPVVDRVVRVGVYPVAGDPLHWGHLLIGLEAIAALGLDKVVFIPQGSDPGKPAMTEEVLRHSVGRAVLREFAPFFAYSPLAMGTSLYGETNLFRLLALNAGQRIHAFYLAGDDHYRLKKENGEDDTIGKIEKNMSDPALGFTPGAHQISLAFLERLGRGPEVPTILKPYFLSKLDFEASSTEIRKNHRYALMPFSGYDYVRRYAPGLYGISSNGQE